MFARSKTNLLIGLILLPAVSGSCGQEESSSGLALLADGSLASGQVQPVLGWIEHRGVRHELRDLADQAYRAESEDAWVHDFPFDTALTESVLLIPDSFELVGSQARFTAWSSAHAGAEMVELLPRRAD